MGLFSRKRKEAAPTGENSIRNELAAEQADKIRLVKNTHKQFGFTAWGFSYLPTSESEGFDVKRARDYIRQMEETNSIISGMLSKATVNVVGAKGFQLQSMTGDRELDATIEKLWKDWTKKADCTGNDWVKHQRLTVRGAFRDGDAGCVDLYSLPDPATGKPLRIDAVAPFEATDLLNPEDAQPHTKGSRIIDGIEYDLFGRPAYFYIRTLSGLGAIPAEHVAFFRNTNKSSNSRGIPALQSSIALFENLNGVVDAEVYASRLNACVVFVQKHSKAPADPTKQPGNVNGVQPGEVVHVYGNDDFSALNPTHPNANFKDAVILFARFGGLPLFLPLEQVLNYWGETNFSSSRASLLEAQKSFEEFQHQFVAEYLTPIFEWKVRQWQAEGKLPEGIEPNHIFIGARFPYLDREKEAQADQMLIDSGQETMRSLMAARGKDFEQWKEERAYEIAECRRLGIPVYHHSAWQLVDSQQQPPTQPQTPPNTDTTEGETNA